VTSSNQLISLISFIGAGILHPTFGQNQPEEKSILGGVTHPSLNVSNIHIVNITSKQYTITDLRGNFKINASVNDTLSIKSIHFLEETLVITPTIFNDGTLQISLKEKVNLLNEVIVGKHQLTGDLERDLSLIPTKKKLSNTELGLPEGVENPHEKIVPFHKVFNLGNPFKDILKNQDLSIPITIALEPLQKHLNGYYKNLKKKRKWDADTQLAEDVIFFYKKEFFENTYGIQKEQIYPFIYFCIESDENFISNFRSNSHSLILKTFEEKSKLFLQQ